VLIVINVFSRCFGLMFTLRVVPVLGPLVIAVLHSFIPMRGMFLFMAMVFATFASVFVIFKDANRSIGFVLAYVYQALVLADRDSAQTISGLDVAHEQLADFNMELFNGGKDEWILLPSAGVALFASSAFSLVLLNLTVGMYTNFYEEMAPMAALVFQQRRARQALAIMLQPPWQLALASLEGGIERKYIYVALALSSLGYVCAIAANLCMGVSGLFLAVAAQLGQTCLALQDTNLGGRNDFLWVSRRMDNADDAPKEKSENDLSLLRSEVNQMRTMLISNRAALSRLVKAVEGFELDSACGSSPKAD